MNKVLTIAVPVYNMQDYLVKCLTSLTSIDQELLHEIEILVINDGSQDNSLSISKSFERQYADSLIVLDKENGNYGSCINTALRHATGRYFRILDADDWFDNSEFERFIIKLKNETADLVVTKFTTWNNGIPDNIVHETVKVEYDHIYNLNSCHIDLQKETWPCSCAMHSMTYKLDVLKSSDIKFIEGISYTDNQYCMQPLIHVNFVSFYNINLYQYNLGRPGQTMSPERLLRSLSDLISVFDSCFNTYRLNKYSNAVTKNYVQTSLIDFAHTIYMMVLTNGYSKDNDSALRSFDYRLRLDPVLYSSMSKSKYAGIYYISLWRCLNNCSVVYYGYTAIYKILKKVFSK